MLVCGVMLMFAVNSETVKILHKIVLLFVLVDSSLQRMKELLVSQKAGEVSVLEANIMQAISSITVAGRQYLPEYDSEEINFLEDELYTELQSFRYAINILSYDYALYSLDKSLLPSFFNWRKAIEKYITRYTAA